MPGGIASDYGIIFSDWVVTSFVSATLDSLFGKIYSPNHKFMNVLIIPLQLTLDYTLTKEVLYSFNFINNTKSIDSSILIWFFIFMTSPNAVKNLLQSYYHFHKFLYGEAPYNVPQMPVASSSMPKTESKCEKC